MNILMNNEGAVDLFIAIIEQAKHDFIKGRDSPHRTRNANRQKIIRDLKRWAKIYPLPMDKLELEWVNMMRYHGITSRVQKYEQKRRKKMKIESAKKGNASEKKDGIVYEQKVLIKGEFINAQYLGTNKKVLAVSVKTSSDGEHFQTLTAKVFGDDIEKHVKILENVEKGDQVLLNATLSNNKKKSQSGNEYYELQLVSTGMKAGL